MREGETKQEGMEKREQEEERERMLEDERKGESVQFDKERGQREKFPENRR